MIFNIDSKNNTEIKNIRKCLDDKQYRKENNCFGVEGLKIIIDLIKNGFEVVKLFFSQHFDNRLIYEFSQKYECIVISNQLFSNISLLKTPEGIMACFKKRTEKYQIQQHKKYLWLEQLQNPGNMATIIRTCICFGIDGIILTKNSVDLFSPKILRDSSGASANINYITYNSAFEALENIKQNGYEIYATCLDETSVDIETVDFNKDIVFVLGNEGNGLDLDFANKCDKKVIIKQKSFDSLNVAVCGAIITYLWSKK